MFDYIYGDKSRHFNFIRLPQILFTDEIFRPLSSDTKILYALLLDRTGLSIKKHWLDSEGRVYINYPIAEICEKIGVGTQKAVRIMKELENFGLIERERLGQGKPDRIYVKHCGRHLEEEDTIEETVGAEEIEAVENSDTDISEFSNSPLQSCENQNSGILKIKTQDFPKSQLPLYSQTERAILSESDLINQSERRIDVMDSVADRKVYEQVIKDNIEYDWFVEVLSMPKSKHNLKGTIEELDEIVEIMVDCVCSTAKTIRVNGENKPTEIVKGQFLKLTNDHIQYVFDRIYGYASEITNMRAYLITTLYNAPMTMNSTFQADFRATFGHF